MLPTEQFSGDATQGPPWTPQVWRDGPDVLVAQARQALFGDRTEIDSGVLGGGDRAMSGSSTAPQNESDQMIDGSTPGDSPSGTPGRQGGRAAQWQQNLAYLRRDEPLAAWSSGQKDGPAMGPANPAP